MLPMPVLVQPLALGPYGNCSLPICSPLILPILIHCTPLEMSCKLRNTLNILLTAISLDCYGKFFQVSRLPDQTGHSKPVTLNGFPRTDEKTGTQQLVSCLSAVGGIAGLKWPN